MKLNRIILPLMACALTWSSCDDQIMEWKNSDGSITASDIPLALKEKIANYDYIKSYGQRLIRKTESTNGTLNGESVGLK